MALGDIFKKSDDQNIEHFWSLVIGKNWVQAGIWRVVDEITQVVSEGNMASWQEGDEDSLITACDSTLSAAATSMSAGVPEPDKAVFGLASSWVEEGSIKEERMDLLKKISKELELSPAGFVVVPEAITHLLKVKDGHPLNAILVGITDMAVDVSLVQIGKVLGTVEVSRSMSLGTDVAEGLSRLPSLNQYPSRILLYNHKAGNLDEARQSLIKMEWADKAHFLHTPKVEILPENISVLAVSLAGGAEVGSAKNVVAGQVVPSLDSSEELIGSPEVEGMGQEKKEEIPAEAELLGFSSEDVAQSVEQETKSVSNIEQQVEGEMDEPVINQPVMTRESRIVSDSFVGVSQPDLVKKPDILGGMGHLATGAGSLFSNLSVPAPRLWGMGKSLAFLAFLGAFLIFGGIAYWYLPKAQVTVYVSPKKLEKSMDFTIDPKLSVIDQANKIVPGEAREGKIAGDKTSSTTGTRTVGERARGKVKILHVGGATTIKSGTVFVGPNSLKFTLDGEVRVASGSGISTPSEVQAQVSAADIGAQYNLASSSKFSVGNFSRDTFEATNTEAFTGGTSRSVSAVSEEDQADILADLARELISKGIENVKGNLARNEVLLEDSARLEAQEKKFSHKVGEETSTLKLSLSGKVSVLVLQRETINSLVRGELDSQIPSGYTLRPDQVEIAFNRNELASLTKDKKVLGKDTEKKEKYSFTAVVTANLLPKVDPEETKRLISGKTPVVAREHLSTIPGFTRAEVSLSPKFPGPLGTLPRVSKNIVVEISAER